jgi:hypothetical protein
MRQVDGEKECVSTRGGLASAAKKSRSNNELREVSRGHSTGGSEMRPWEGLNNRKSEERTKGGQCGESRISWKEGLPAKG